MNHMSRPRGMAWMKDLTRGDKGPHSTVSNTILIICNDPNLQGMLAYDEFSHAVVATRAPPPAFEGASRTPGPYPRPTTDADVTLMQGYIQRTFDMRISQPVAQQACAAAAEQNRVHPVRDWLRELRWDNKPRIAQWLSKAFGVPSDAYHEAVGVKFLVAAVRRVRRPGVKFDNVPVLEGLQGSGKSRACETLFSSTWFKDDLAHDLSDKDAQQGMAGRWGIELAEVQVLVRSTSQAAKAFFSRQVDHFRPSYGRSFVERPRQCVFVGTTNETDYLSDSTGNRRYWPIRCQHVDVEWIRVNREQLWAEAAYLEEIGTTLWLEDETIRRTAEVAQDGRMAVDLWTKPVLDHIRGQHRVMMFDLVYTALGLPRDKHHRSVEMRVAAILRRHGWVQHAHRHDGPKVREWFAPDTELPGTGGKRSPPLVEQPDE